MREPLRREGRQAQRAPNNCFMSGGLRVNGGENLTVIVKLLICPALVLAQRETANRVECTGVALRCKMLPVLFNGSVFVMLSEGNRYF